MRTTPPLTWQPCVAAGRAQLANTSTKQVRVSAAVERTRLRDTNPAGTRPAASRINESQIIQSLSSNQLQYFYCNKHKLLLVGNKNAKW